VSRNDPTNEELQQAVDALAAYGSQSAAARALGMSRKTFIGRLDQAVRRGIATAECVAIQPNQGPPEGYKLKGTSTYYDKDGLVRGQWVKTNAAIEALQAMQKAVFEQMCSELKPLKKIAAPKRCDQDLLTLYTLTDCHVGMLAWDKETGADWDLAIAENTICEMFIRMIDAAPASAVGIVNQLGDFLHFDSLVPLTPTSHHVLDADSRYQKVVDAAVRILRRVIEHALTKHEKVQVYMIEGNHDPTGSVWLRVMFTHLYEKNQRVTVGLSPNPYEAYQHGLNLIGFHHGHLAKKEKLPLLFAAKFPQMWGATEFRVVHVGHLHNVVEQEHAGISVYQHPTVAAPDAYAARNGWLSKRQATSMTYDKNDGEINRDTFIPRKPK
jgi:hypothetical protein